MPRVNIFAIMYFFTGIKQWHALVAATSLLSNKQDFKSEVKKLLLMKLIKTDEEIYFFLLIPYYKYYIIVYFLFILYLLCTIVQLHFDLTILRIKPTYVP